MLLGFLALDVEGITNSHPINLLTILNYVSFIIFIILSLCLSFTHTHKINQIKYKSAFGIRLDLSLMAPLVQVAPTGRSR